MTKIITFLHLSTKCSFLMALADMVHRQKKTTLQRKVAFQINISIILFFYKVVACMVNPDDTIILTTCYEHSLIGGTFVGRYK